jgi:serpin B
MRPSCAAAFLAGLLSVFSARANAFGEEVAAPAILVTPRVAEDEAIHQALAKRRAWKFVEAPLAAVQAEFAKELGANVVIDSVAAEMVNLNEETTVTLDLRNASARTALDLICREIDMDWLVRNGVLLLTTEEDVNEAVDTRVYDLAAIYPAFDAEGIELPFYREDIIELITSVIEPTNWTDVGGNGVIEGFGSDTVRGLVVSQTRRGTVSLEKMLKELAQLRKLASTEGQGVAPPRRSDVAAENARIFTALEQRQDWDFQKKPFTEALAMIEAAIGVDVVLDRYSVAAGPQFTANPVVLHEATARAALEAAIPSSDLTWTILDDLIFVTATEEAEQFLAVQVYDLNGLHPAKTAAGNEIEFDFETIIELITSNIDPSSWTEVGGSGAIQDFETGSLKAVVVLQTPRNHAAIAKLLAELRALQARAPEPKAPFTPNALRDAPSEALANITEESSNSADPPAAADLPARSRRFALKLYHEVASVENEDVLVSPYSAFEALGMVYAGAGGKTQAELAGALDLTGLSPEDSAPLFGNLRRETLAHAKLAKNELRIANCLWGQEGYPFRPQYLQALGQQFNSMPEQLNFLAPDVAALRINKWADEATAGRISDVVSPTDFDDVTRFMLTNAVYFKAAWKQPFELRDSRRGVFKAADDLQVHYMHQRLSSQYAETDELQLASLPYAGDRFSMLFLLPREDVALKQFESNLSIDQLDRWTDLLKKHQVDWKLPKFRFEAKMALNDALKNLGATSMFNIGNADLSGMSPMAAKEGLAIDEVRQKTFIEVNETGTEAAAVTTGGGVGGFGNREPEPLVNFHAERPFLFLIRDDETGVILFMGRVTKPEYPEEKPRGRSKR